MNNDVQTPVVESSTATPELPDFNSFSESERYEWRKTGNLPSREAKPTPQESAPAKHELQESSETPDGDEAEAGKSEAAPASEPGKNQERRPHRGTPEPVRVKELLADRKADRDRIASLERQIAEITGVKKADSPTAGKAEEKASEGPKAPVRPKMADYDGKTPGQLLSDYEAAMEKYENERDAFKSAQTIDNFKRQQQQELEGKLYSERLTQARKDYADFDAVAGPVVKALAENNEMHPAVRQMISASPVLPHLMYVLGGKKADMEKLFASSKSDPFSAIRQVVVLEALVMEELGKKANGGQPSERAENGQFIPKKESASERPKVSAAPDPPIEINGKGTPPADEVEAAVADEDFGKFRNAANRRDLARRKG